MSELLQINNLIVAFENPEGELTAVKGVSLALNTGETLALVGESGCGKTVLCKSMLKILCEKGSIRQGEILLEGRDLVSVTEREMLALRGGDIAMVFQDPMTSLDPAFSVGEQIAEVLRTHKKLSHKAAHAQAVKLMEMVKIPEADLRYDQRPYQFSGGMRQRIVIAIALAGEPKLLLADEPTTALDEETQEEILKLLKELQQQTNVAVLFITHDLSLVEDIAQRVAIMKDGCVVEQGDVKDIFACPQHEYTRKLLGYLDYKKGRGHDHKHHLLQGCRGRSQSVAGEAMAAEKTKTAAHEAAKGFISAEAAGAATMIENTKDTTGKTAERACINTEDTDKVAEWACSNVGGTDKTVERGRGGVDSIDEAAESRHFDIEDTGKIAERECDGIDNPALGRGVDKILEIKNLDKSFRLDKKNDNRVLQSFSMDIYSGEIVGLVGRSGCGKSTLARCIMGIEKPDSGSVSLKEGINTQMIFQDSQSAFNDRMTIEQIIAEPLRISRGASHHRNAEPKPYTAGEAVLAAMTRVELNPALISRRPYELSGGQRQRVAIARALITDPDFIIADEPLTGLDVSAQAQIVHLLRKLADEQGLTILFIAHDIPMVNHISDRIVQL